VLINGIGQVADRPDLLDRVALIELAAIAPHERRGEDELWAAWELERPRILGALLDAVATALARVDEVELAELPRLADFARWVEAAAPALGWPSGAFTAALMSGREELLEGSADARPEIVALIELMDERHGLTWEGGAGELLELLTDRVGDKVAATRGWPKRADTLSNRLKEHAPLLREKGTEI
jgi:hypothetical protein